MASNFPLPGQRALRRGRTSLVHRAYHLTIGTQDRTPWFTHCGAAHQTARCLEDCSLLGDAVTLAWVLMPDHLHWLCQLGENDPLPVVVARMKSATARKANAALGRKGALWQKGYHERAVRSRDDIEKVARYMVANPVRAGLAEDPGGYPYWNCAWL